MYMYECPAHEDEEATSAIRNLNVEEATMNTKLADCFAWDAMHFLHHEDVGLHEGALQDLELRLLNYRIMMEEPSSVP